MSSKSNLDRFLHSSTPCIRAHVLPETEIGKLNKQWFPDVNDKKVKYFTLADLWNCYEKSSACGIEVPVNVGAGGVHDDRLVQYFVPYLSALQIFTDNPSADHHFSDKLESEIRDSSSYESSSTSDESPKSKWDGLSDEGEFEQYIPSQLDSRLGCLYVEYLESSGLNVRVPLINKINDLSCRYPGLMSLRSIDISPASWMAVAWYPIYHFPSKAKVKDLSTCFLTYHTLSSTFLDDDDFENGEIVKEHEDQNVYLKPFGLATYKLQGDVWAIGKGRDRESLMILLSIADSWLKQLNVDHHDFNYFTRMR